MAPDGLTMATSSQDFMVKLWSAPTGKAVSRVLLAAAELIVLVVLADVRVSLQ